MTREESALVIVDMQNNFCHPKGAFTLFSQRHSKDVQLIQDMVPRLKRLLSEARAKAVPIIFMRTFNTEWTTSSLWRNRMSGEMARLWTEAGEWGTDFHDDFRPVDGECVVVKRRHSSFLNTELDLILRSRGIKTLVVTGVATNVCVQLIAAEGFNLGYQIIVVEDCTASNSLEAHQAAITNVREYYGTTISSDELIREWEGAKK